jgi:hypothetical protein
MDVQYIKRGSIVLSGWDFKSVLKERFCLQTDSLLLFRMMFLDWFS